MCRVAGEREQIHPARRAIMVRLGCGEVQVETHRTGEASPTARRVEVEQLRAAQQAAAQGEAVPHGIGSIGILVLAVLSVIYTLYFGKEILLPIAFAVVVKLLLLPVMRLLQERLRFPGALASLLLIITVFGAIAAVG